MPTGRWSIALTIPDPGSYKVFADTAPGDATEPIVLAAELAVPGNFQPRPLPPASASTQVDGYTVSLSGELVAGTASALDAVGLTGRPRRSPTCSPTSPPTATWCRCGSATWPTCTPTPRAALTTGQRGSGITFFVDVPTAGDYQLYLDFQHAGVVHTAAFTPWRRHEH